MKNAPSWKFLIFAKFIFILKIVKTMSTVNSIDLGALSKQYSARDLPGQQKLKYRETGQNAPDEVRKDRKELRRELEERERIGSNKESSSSSKRLSIADKESEKSSSKKQRLEPIAVNLDADEVLPDSDDDDNKSEDENDDREDEDEDDDEDDDADAEALLAELNKIKRERAAEAARQEAERKLREEKIRVENILKGNPLLSEKKIESSEFKVKRRWDDDVVFKNCAKLDDGNKKGFINDTLRSEFHKKFMERYIK